MDAHIYEFELKTHDLGDRVKARPEEIEPPPCTKLHHGFLTRPAPELLKAA